MRGGVEAGTRPVDVERNADRLDLDAYESVRGPRDEIDLGEPRGEAPRDDSKPAAPEERCRDALSGASELRPSAR